MCRQTMEKFLINRVDLESQWDIRSCSPAPPPRTPTPMAMALLRLLLLKCKAQHPWTGSFPTYVLRKASHPSLTHSGLSFP